jgi:hypothetical protein
MWSTVFSTSGILKWAQVALRAKAVRIAALEKNMLIDRCVPTGK